MGYKNSAVKKTSTRLNNQETYSCIARVVEEHYGLGRVIDIRRNTRGYINDNFEVATLSGGNTKRYIVRRYRSETTSNKIWFEHALLQRLAEKGFHYSPLVIAGKDGQTWTKLEGAFIAIFSYLEGEDRYKWDSPDDLDDAELRSVAEMLALYHHTIWGCEDIQTWRESRAIDRVLFYENKWTEYADSTEASVFQSFVQMNLGYLLSQVNLLQEILPKGVYDSLPHLAIHGDYHPGNLKFKDKQAIGIFDFDWSRIDARCFDLSLALIYFCTVWKPCTNGRLLPERAISFLSAYQEAAKNKQGIGPLTKVELQNLPAMIRLANLFLVDWILEDYYNYRLNPDPETYLNYLRHSLNLFHWGQVLNFALISPPSLET